MRWAHLIGIGLVAGLAGPSRGADGGGQAVEEAALVAAGAASLDQLGFSADVDRETLVAGTPLVWTAGVGETGAAYVFVLGPGGWVQQAELFDPSPSSGAGFGTDVAVEGDRVAVSANFGTSQYGKTGSVSVFVRSGSSWTLEQEFAPPDGVNFGEVLDLEGDVLLVGDISATGAGPFTGAAYVFERVAGTWTQTGKLFKAQGETSDNMGGEVALAGDTALVVDSTDSLGGVIAGSFTVFDRVGASWVEGPTIFNPTGGGPSGGFGAAIDEDGDVAVIGASGDNQFGPSAGVAYVYARDGTTWTLQQTLTGDGLGVVTQQERFGQSVAIDGGRLLVGSPWDDVPGAFRIGSVYRFELAGGTWIQVERIAPAGLGPADSFGWAVGLDGDLVAGTAPGDDTAGQSSGAAYVLRAPPFRTHYCTAGTSASGCKALISASGVPSATAPTGFDLRVEGVEGAKRGLFYWGTNGRKASPWGTGTSYQCLKLPPSRGKLLQEQGTKGACDGAYTYDLNKRWTVKPNQNPGAGATVQAQFWYRDPFNGFFPKTSLSDAIEFVVCP